MISHRHRCIYVKMPKCASTSVRDWFLAHGGGRHAYRPSWYPGPLPYRIQSLGHALELWPGYFTFTFLRDPYRRFMSLYLHANRYAEERAARIPDQPGNNGTLPEFAALCGELLADTRGLWGPQARAFLRDRPDRRYGPLGIALRYLPFVFNHVRPQVDFLPDCNPERLFGLPRTHPRPLSFIGAVETLDADFGRLQDVLGLPRLALPRHNASGPAPDALEALRRDADTRRLVGELYAEDLAFTGRAFDGAPAPHAAPPIRPPLPAVRPPAAARLRRARLTLASLQIGLEARIVRTPPVRRVLAPLARLRRKVL